MKRIVSILMFIVLCFSASSAIFSQKLKQPAIKKNPETQSLKLAEAQGFSDGNGVYLKWVTEIESNNIGFNVYRSNGKENQRVNPVLLPGGYLQSSEPVVNNQKYSFFDKDGTLDDFYYLESISTDGQKQFSIQIFPQFTQSLIGISDQTFDNLREAALQPEVELVQNDLLLPKTLQKTLNLNSLPPDLTTQHWVASQPGVKLAVKTEGLYRVTKAQLQAAGFDTNAAGNLWQLYLDGKEQSIIVGNNNDYIEFYGRGMDTPESDTRYYYLIVGSQDGKRMNSTIIPPVGRAPVSTNYQATNLKKVRTLHVSTLLNGDLENFFGDLISSTPINFNFPLTGVDFSVSNSTIQLTVQGLIAGPHQIRAVLNGHVLNTFAGIDFNSISGTFNIPTSFLLEGTNTIEFTGLAGTGDYTLFDSVRVNYSRKFQSDQNRIRFYTDSDRSSRVGGFSTGNIRVFDLSVPDNPKTVTNLSSQQDGATFSVLLPASKSRILCAAENSSFLSPSAVITNAPSTLSTTAHNANIVIISYKDWMTQANNWANYRIGQGFSVEVVNIEDIFDEFSYGSTSTTGITNFLKFAKNNWQTPPQYILIIGDTTYDFRNYENSPIKLYVPTKLIDTQWEETGSDEALADFNNDGLAEISIGRIPIQTGAEVTMILNKVINFEATVSTAFNRGSLCVSDLPIGYDFEALCNRLAPNLPPTMPKFFINRGQSDSRNVLLSSLNTGKYLVNYSGHGTTGAWSGSDFFSSPDAAQMNNSGNLTILMMLTCLNGYFLNTSGDGLAETALKNPNGGAVATWASTGRTTPPDQEVMATRFYSQITAGNLTRLGDLIQDAKQSVILGRDIRLSWALLGDPALKIR